MFQPENPDVYLPFRGKLNPKNRWVKLAACYGESPSDTGMGAPALSGRVSYGALVIKERLGITDAETVEQFGENSHLQCVLVCRGMLKEASPLMHR